ncbi:MAG: nucleotide exchange factor GrpE, partial [Acidimicrobiales bacterium]
MSDLSNEPRTEEPQTEPEPEPDAADPEAGTEAAAPPDDEEDLLAQTVREREEYLDALRRLQADFENYKKRIAKQQAEMSARATEALVDRLLPVLDVADLAVAHGAG